MAPPPAPIEYAQEKVRLGKTMFSGQAVQIPDHG